MKDKLITKSLTTNEETKSIIKQMEKFKPKKDYIIIVPKFILQTLKNKI